MKIGEIIHGFKLISITPIPEKDMEAYRFEHVQSGADTIWLKNKDLNKAFCIAFKTIPEDSTGVFHILEHSVLCGSKKYPVKEPFVDLLKGSMQTFLNAMTYGDKTMYPVSSMNDKDFMNLMGIYLDAVFAPRVYTTPEVFLQEGWHFEPSDGDKKACFSGVVYNEMKGNLSSPDSVFYDRNEANLLPDTCYALCSGGDPAFIPDLTYEQFLANHKKFYSPENSYITFYGDMDIEPKLEYLNVEYLSKYTKTGLHFDFVKQQPYGHKDVVEEYPLNENETLENKSIISYSCLTCDFDDRKTQTALSIILRILTKTNDSPLKKAILDAKIAEDFSAFLVDGIYQPYVLFRIKNTNEDKKDLFVEILLKTLKEVVKNGIDKNQLEATFASTEFSILENDNGNSPGVNLACDMMETWLYGGDPLDELFDKAILDDLHSKLSTNYFEDLIEKYILNSNHTLTFVLKPSHELDKSNQEKLQKRIEAYEKKIGEKGIEKAKEQLELLKKYQSSPDTKEAKQTIPHLNIDDIDKENIVYVPQVSTSLNAPYHYHPLQSNSITYYRSFFDISDLPYEDYGYLKLLSSFLFFTQTEKYSLSEFQNQKELYVGSMFSFPSTMHVYQREDNRLLYGLMISFIDRNFDKVKEIFDQGFNHIVWDKEEIRKNIKNRKVGCEADLLRNGSSYATKNAGKFQSQQGYAEELLYGNTYCQFIFNLNDHFDEEYDKLILKFNELLAKIKSNLAIQVLVSCDDMNKKYLESPFAIPNSTAKFDLPVPPMPEKKRVHEAHKNSGTVVYNGYYSDYSHLGLSANGKLNVMAGIVRLDYLWNKVRVMGGAYGAFLGISPFDSRMTMSSYRDPNLVNTYKAFDGVVEYLENFDCDDDDMMKYIVGAISQSDPPPKPRDAAISDSFRTLSNITDEVRQKVRDDMLSTKQEDIRAFAPIFKEILKNVSYTTFGSAKIIEENQALFDNFV